MSCLWAIENMQSLKIHHIIFASDAVDLLGAVNRPPAWLSFRHHAGQGLTQCLRPLVEKDKHNIVHGNEI